MHYRPSDRSEQTIISLHFMYRIGIPVTMPEQAESTLDAESSIDSVDAEGQASDRCKQDEPLVDEYDPEFDRDYVPDVIWRWSIW